MIVRICFLRVHFSRCGPYCRRDNILVLFFVYNLVTIYGITTKFSILIPTFSVPNFKAIGFTPLKKGKNKLSQFLKVHILETPSAI